MKYVSLFAGIGGFDLALNRFGHECVWANEWDKYASQIYEKNFRHRPDTRSITDVQTGEIPDHALLVGGFPCQAFSIAGKRGGFADTRGTLFFEIARILQAKQPSYFILENVKGLLSHERGRTFKTIISTLSQLGYDLQWQVLNSKNFGVPQNRERVFIVGHIRGEPRPKVFPLGAYDKENDGVQSEENKQGAWIPCLNTRYGQRWSGEGYIATGIKQMNKPKHSNNRVYAEDGISPTLNTMQGGRRQPKVIVHYGHKNKPAVEMDISPTLKAQSHGHEPMTTNGMKIRRLTPLECERLQGFPDNWTQGVSDTQRYKQLGNAVTVNVVEEIAKRLT